MNSKHIPDLVHSDGVKKQISTKEKMERPTPIKTGQAWSGLYPIAAATAAAGDIFIKD